MAGSYLINNQGHYNGLMTDLGLLLPSAVSHSPTLHQHSLSMITYASPALFAHFLAILRCLFYKTNTPSRKICTFPRFFLSFSSYPPIYLQGLIHLAPLRLSNSTAKAKPIYHFQHLLFPLRNKENHKIQTAHLKTIENQLHCGQHSHSKLFHFEDYFHTKVLHKKKKRLPLQSSKCIPPPKSEKKHSSEA